MLKPEFLIKYRTGRNEKKEKINNMVKRDTEKKYAIFSMYGKIII